MTPERMPSGQPWRYCSECGDKAKSRGLCGKHYDRARSQGKLPDVPDQRFYRLPEDVIWARAKERFWEKVEMAPSGCWLWTGHKSPDGYGYFPVRRKVYRSHAMSYIWATGQIEDGLVFDHLCRVRNCVNPDHLEPVTTGENNLRGLRSFDLPGVCRAGLHDVTDPANIRITYQGKRLCRLCHNARQVRYRAKKKARAEE